MKNMLGLILLFLLVAACEKDTYFIEGADFDEVVTPREQIVMVPFRGKFGTIALSPNFTGCSDPATGVVIPMPMLSAVTGDAMHLGKLHSTNSPLFMWNCSVDSETHVLTATLDMTFRNKNGDGLRFVGESDMSLAGPFFGNYEVTEGYGIFEGAQGWITTTGSVDFEQGIVAFEADGEVSQPNLGPVPFVERLEPLLSE